jgi:hypothetical protein
LAEVAALMVGDFCPAVDALVAAVRAVAVAPPPGIELPFEVEGLGNVPAPAVMVPVPELGLSTEDGRFGVGRAIGAEPLAGGEILPAADAPPETDVSRGIVRPVDVELPFRVDVPTEIEDPPDVEWPTDTELPPGVDVPPRTDVPPEVERPTEAGGADGMGAGIEGRLSGG